LSLYRRCVSHRLFYFEGFLLKNILILFIRLYQWTISPLLGKTCRFLPSCSTYFLDALKMHGFFKGCSLGLRRLSKCHAWHPGGYDPVPEISTEIDPLK